MSQDDEHRLAIDTAIVGTLIAQYAGNDAFDAWHRIKEALSASPAQPAPVAEMEDKTGFDAPVWYSDSEAVAWAAGWNACRNTLYATPPAQDDALRVAVAIKKIPTRKERMGGQLLSYVQLDEVLAILEQAQ